VWIDANRLYINNVSAILAVLRAIITGVKPAPLGSPVGTGVAGT
jgi:hypothetical protein